MKLKMFMVVGLTALVLSACGSQAATTPTAAPGGQATQAGGATQAATPAPVVGAGDTVARVDSVVLTRKTLDERIARLQAGFAAQPAQPGQPLPSALDIEKELVERFIQQSLTMTIAKQRQIEVSDQEVTDRISFFRTNIEGQGGKLEEAIQSQLGFAGENSTDFREFVLFFVAREKLGNTLVTTDTVRSELTQQYMAEVNNKVDQVRSSHILIRVEKPEDDATALKKAEDIIARLAKGESFEDIAKVESQDPGSAVNGGDLGWATQGQFVPEFDKAIFQDLKPGESTAIPVKTQFGYHIIKVISREQRASMTEDEAKQLIEQALPQQIARARAEAVQNLVTQEREKAKTEGRLVEPTYPEPTPVPLPTLPPQPTVTP